MRIKTRLALLMGAFTLFAVLLFSGLLYITERNSLAEQELKRLAGMTDALARVAEESILSQDDLSLLSYVFKLKASEPLLESSFVHDGDRYLAHTDKNLVLEKAAPLFEAGEGLEAISRSVEKAGKKYQVTAVFSRRLLDESVASGMESLLRHMFLAAAMALLAALAAAAAVSERITRPLLQLSGAAARVGEGDLSVSVQAPAGSGGREISLLRDEFNAMVRRLKELDEMKKDFVSAVTHELKSPLSAISSYLDLILSEAAAPGPKDDAMLRKWADDIACAKQNVARLYSFINNVLDAAKIEKGKFEIRRSRFDFAGLAEEVVRLFAGKAASLEVSLRTELDVPGTLEADPERLRQVLTNLISNALKFTRPGGQVLVKAGLNDHQGEAARQLLVSVSDSGAGIPAQALPRLFGKFEQVKGARVAAKGDKGAGLGLYISKTIVEGHGGRIWVESEDGRGSVFYFTLPVNL